MLSDTAYLKAAYRLRMGKRLNLAHPQTFNEKLQWLKLNDRQSVYTRMADKFAARAFVAERIGERHLIPLLGVWDDPEDIDFDDLPNKFVLKCNHNSGLGMCICKDKASLDIKQTKAALARGLRENYYLRGREWPYRDIPRKIVAEAFIEDASGDLKDYKFLCFNGKVELFDIDFDRFINHHVNYYDIHGKLLPVGLVDFPPLPERNLPIPDNLEEMISIAETLAQGCPFLRVDLYNVNGAVYFGEMTFFPSSGMGKFFPEEWDTLLGEQLTLPEVASGV